eukprot:CAMPEP_0198205512 /NCGR_PEP_ID=MMETSP1445-20131203/9058_1 /TAXON_ID=36898 /ORGANISM="Pyramimonas sp., Strain CCMP2087" /LENGTH=556 /DNA_ID=CAMNT_0043877847 /DNA_START=476 /DNA_END=2146 /DNA_ORIENTATION=-
MWIVCIALLIAGCAFDEVVAHYASSVEINDAVQDVQGVPRRWPRASLGMPRALLAAVDDDDEEEEDDAEEDIDIDGEKVVRGKKERPDSHVEYESHHEGDISGLAASHTEEALKSAPKYLPRIYADSAFRRFFADLDKEDESQKTGKDEEKRYLASRKKEREKAHTLGDKKYNEWHKKDQEFLDAIKKKKVKQKEAERLKLEQLKDAETQIRGRPLQHFPGSNAPDPRLLPAFHMDAATLAIWRQSLMDAGLKEVMEIMKNGTCAIVGNAGHLRLTEFGDSVDSHDVVIRLNAAPTVGYEKYVGTKTHVRVLNNALAKELTDRVNKWSKDMWERMLEPGVSLWMRATDESTDELRAALVKNNDHRPVVKMEHDFTYAAMPIMRQFYLEFLKQHRLKEVERSKPLAQRLHTLKELRMKHIAEGQFGKRGDEMFGKPTTGLAVLYALKDMCGATTVYGVGTHDAKGNPTEYKYYKPDSKFIPAGNQYAGTVGSHTHSFEFEQELMIALGLTGDGRLKYCSYNPEAPAENLDCRVTKTYKNHDDDDRLPTKRVTKSKKG